MQKPELVLPVGSMEKLTAAIAGGADAVYLGAKKFSARATAENFSDDALPDAIALCHSHGKKAYLAINTLIKDAELDEAIDIAKVAYIAGVDAIIVQDLGLIKALRELLPDLPLHASTQMTCHNGQGAEFLASLGVKRIVLARELTLREVKEIVDAVKPLGVEIECFAHGAMCFSFSGQCLFSSFVFNKSGNRGRCLQPCRMEYELRSLDGKESHKGFLLSMKDLTTLDNVRDLADAGIHALKIEGRLKEPAYAFAAARAYRMAIDSCFGGGNPPSEKELKELRSTFQRESTSGYLFGKYGMISKKTPQPLGEPAAVFISQQGTRSKMRLLGDISKRDKLVVPIKDKLREFEISRIFSRDCEVSHAKKGWIVQIETRAKLEMLAEERLFFPKAGEKSPSFALPPRKFAVKRRNLDEASFAEKKWGLLSFALKGNNAQGKPDKWNGVTGTPDIVIFTNTEHIRQAAGFNCSKTVCYVSDAKQVEYFKKLLPIKSRNKLLFKPPTIQTSTDLDSFEDVIKSESIVCSNLGSLQLAICNKARFWAGRELNVFNTLAAKLLLELGAEMIEPSLELSLKQLLSNSFSKHFVPVIFAYPLLMISRAYAKSLDLKQRSYIMRDRKGFRYRVELDEKGLMRIYNPLPLDMIDNVEKFSQFSSVGIDLSGASLPDASDALRRVAERDPYRKTNSFTRGHYEREVE